MQVAPDYSKRGTAEELEANLIGFKFRGPGWYLTKADTLLVVPTDPTDHPWASGDADTLWTVHVWNCEFADTVFARCTEAPNRQDER